MIRIFIIGMRFDGSTFLNAFILLYNAFHNNLNNHPCNLVRGWCKQYCDSHWVDENFDWNVSSVNNLFIMLRGSSYHNPFNPGLLKFLAEKSREVFLINSVKNYEKEFSCRKIEDIDIIRKIAVTDRKESALIVKCLLKNKVTVGQLWNFCSPRLSEHVFHPNNANTLILDATEPLLEYYNSVTVSGYNWYLCM